jgi:pilus assembly protein FimV
VKAGDSLSRIASRTARAGVSLDQMLVSLYRGNPQAFIDNNMNRLKAGVVLAVPAADAAKAITPSDARQVIQAQSADFGAYRQRLASGVPNARAEGSTRVASGKVTAKVEDRQTGSGTAPDKLTLSKGATPAKSAGEDKIAKDRAKQADDLRVAELKKNVEDLKKLSGATATAASASKPATTTVASKPAAPAPAPAPAVAAASVPAPATVAAPRPPVASAPVVAAAPAPAPAPVASAVVATAPASASAALGAASVASVASAPAPVVAAASAPAPRPAASAPVVAAKPNATPSDDSGGLGTLIEDNATAFGVGAALIALLGGWGLYRFLQRKKKDSGETSFLESRLQPDSFFGASGGQRIDTRDAGGASSSMSYSLSQLDAIGDVDPVAEADVYLAYGRDLQAEEILKEAMRSNPDRMAIRTKLLEVYAKRRDTKGFELLATQLFALTKGEGEDWAKAQELGAQMDPDNPLFRPGGAPVMAQGEGGQMIEPLGASTMPQSVLPSPSRFASSQSIAPMPMPAPGANDRLDLDLDLGDPSRTDPATAPAASAASLQATQAIAPPATASRDDDLALDFSLPDVPELQAKSSPHLSEPSTFDLSEISLDLDMPQAKPASALDRASGFGDIDLPSPDDDPNADPLARKLELAEEFRQIGDMDGARDLLHEVVARSSGALKSRAQSMLADLG